jgi:uncharacterized protein YndB with AHSA1/START domain
MTNRNDEQERRTREILMTKLATASVHVDAPPETVWKALTDPALVRQYFFGTEVESDWQVGSPVTYRGEWEGTPYEDRGTVLQSEPPNLLVTSYFSPGSGLPDVPENHQHVTYRITAADSGSTLVEVEQDNNRDDQAAEHSSANWAAILDGLARVAAAEA